MTHSTRDEPIDLAAIRQAAGELSGFVRRTPTWELQGSGLAARLPAGTRVVAKLELFQHTGSFKVRAAFLALRRLSPEQRARGVVTFSAGNHAVALAFCARQIGTSARVVMPRSASPARVDAARALGAEIELCADVHAALARTEAIVAAEGRTFVHPFEGRTVALGTATVGLELVEDAPDLDVVVVPVGGGGLCAGVAAAVKQALPRCTVVGVEPEGADTMHRSFAAGTPQAIERIATIADSLGAPRAAPFSFETCRRFVDDLVRVDDDALCAALAVLFADAKLAVEPAGAAATAAVLGPLRSRVAGKTVGVVVCGANIDATTFTRHLERGTAFG